MDEKRNISTDDIINLTLSTYGGVETLRFYQRQLSKITASLNTAIEDGNMMLAAKHAGVLNDIVDKMSKIIMSTSNANELNKISEK